MPGRHGLRGYIGFKSIGEDFGHCFDRAVLEVDGPKGV